eukprot:gnl/MRDRNA2_/MRDRNA2_186164_c0_seq1.p1 gnl/MRDRNA2_/MRDRNA2_186164_c0~~gnl/MRDRNA2_/MRDRNA2_186164_c0_seq1.p1  ORF type:complete len:167 (-),score=23.31 gnl/MRDRNA2_/MRDRNA2_186164_c0_seq1:18-461(-)
MSTPGTHVTLVSSPVLGEELSEKAVSCETYGDLTAAPNVRLAEWAEIVKRVATQAGASYIPFQETLREFLIKEGPGKHNVDRSFTPARFLEISSELFPKLMSPGVIFNDLTPEGFLLSHDLVHFNERGAAMLCALIHSWLESHLVQT